MGGWSFRHIDQEAVITSAVIPSKSWKGHRQLLHQYWLVCGLMDVLG